MIILITRIFSHYSSTKIKRKNKKLNEKVFKKQKKESIYLSKMFNVVIVDETQNFYGT